MTDTYALVGHPLTFSLSPAIHRAGFQDTGVDAEYVLRPTAPDDLPTVMDALRAGELAGINVTVPHKVAIRHMVEDETGIVARLGAVNTVVRSSEGHWRGENTDASGFLHVLRDLDMDRGHGRRAVILGAGGAARAAGGVLLQAGYAVDILNRSSSRAGVMASHLYRHFRAPLISTGPLERDVIVSSVNGAALLVNATPLGAEGADPSPWPEDAAWPADTALIDMVAWPPETALVRRVRAAGAPARGGLPMLVAQAAAAQRLWTGRTPSLEIMERAARSAIEDHLPLPSDAG